MKKKIQPLLFLFFFFSLFSFSFSIVRAEDVLIFHFYQYGDVLKLDSKIQTPIILDNDPNFSVLEFSKKSISGQYRIEFIDVTESSAVSYEFPGKEGAFSFEFPHFGIVKGYKVYSTKDNTLLLEGSLAEFVKCNANSICEYERGENLNTCLADCISGSFSDETKKLLKQNNDVLTDPKTGEVLLRGIAPVAGTSTGGVGGTGGGADAVVLVVGIVVLLLIIGGVVVVIRLRKRNRQYGL